MGFARPSARKIFLVALAVMIAGAAAIAIDQYGTAFLRRPSSAWSPGAVDARGSDAASASSDLSFSFLDQPRPLPDVHFVDGDGSVRKLSDFRGKLVLLNLWATWCVPCRKEMPALDRLQAMLGGPDFEVVALSIDRQGISVVRPFYEQLGIKAVGIYIDQSGKAAQLLQTVGVPTTLLIDGESREIARKMGAIEWDSPARIALIRQHLAVAADTRARMSSKVNR